MKLTIIKKLMLAIALLSAVNVNAADLRTALRIVAGKDGKNIQVFAQDLNAGTVHLSIKDADDLILMEDVVAGTENVAKRYRLENLPNGNYIITISNNLEQVIQPFEITVNGFVKLDKENRKAIFKPVVKMRKNDKLDINLLLNAATDVELQLFDVDYEKIYEASFSDFGQVFTKRLNVAGLNTGKYLIKVKYDDQVFYQTVDIQ